jgi:hypothetical protein
MNDMTPYVCYLITGGSYCAVQDKANIFFKLQFANLNNAGYS